MSQPPAIASPGQIRPRPQPQRPALTRAQCREVIALCQANPKHAFAATYCIDQGLPPEEARRRLAELEQVSADCRRFNMMDSEAVFLAAVLIMPESPGKAAGMMFAEVRAASCPVIDSHIPPNRK